MRGNVLQTWTPPLLVLTVLLIVAAASPARYRGEALAVPQLFESASATEYCAVPAPTVGRRIETAQRMGPRQTAAMLVMLMAQRGGRFGGFAR